MEDLHKQLDALVEQESSKRVAQVLDGLLSYIAELRKQYGPQTLPVKFETSPQEAAAATPVETAPANDAVPEPSDEKKYKDVDGVLRRFKKNCNYCGAEFATDIAEREYCCRDHLESDIGTEELGVQGPPVSMDAESVARHSEGQQARRNREADAKPPHEPASPTNQLASKHNDRWHGTPSGYSNHKCRCTDCTEAWRIYIAPRMRARHEAKQEPAKRPSEPIVRDAPGETKCLYCGKPTTGGGLYCNADCSKKYAAKQKESTYPNQLADFQSRMAKRGITIPDAGNKFAEDVV